MAIFYCAIKNITKKNATSAVGASAYRAGAELTDETRQQTFNYQNKQGIKYTEVILCKNAPEEYANREKLWNEVQKIEKASDARLAREFVVAIPREFDFELSKKVVKNFAQSLAEEGMCVDFAIHDTGNGNPHAHIMVTTRSIDENKKWMAKKKNEYKLDKNGKPIPLIDPQTGEQKRDSRNRKQWKRYAVDTNDWNTKEKGKEWKERWANICNRHLELDNQIDHRSYEEQEIEKIPTKHEGYYARKVEQQGGVSAVCAYNRCVRMHNKVYENRKKKKYGYIASSIFSFTGDWHGELSEIFLTKDKKVAFVDIKNHILVRKTDEETVLSALKHAQEKWGSVKLNGSKEYIDKCIELAIRNDITITNPELQEQIEAKKQALAKQEQQNNDFIERKGQEINEWLKQFNAAGSRENNTTSERQNRGTGDGDPQIDAGKRQSEFGKLVAELHNQRLRETVRKLDGFAGKGEEAKQERRGSEYTRGQTERQGRGTEQTRGQTERQGRETEKPRKGLGQARKGRSR